MPKLNCPYHGESYAAMVCPHIEKALNNDNSIIIKKIREKLFDDDSEWIYYFCTKCIGKFGLSEKKIYEDIDERKTKKLIPVCSKCLNTIK